MKCPHCKKTVGPDHFICAIGAKGGKAKSAAKTRANRRNARKRWQKPK